MSEVVIIVWISLSVENVEKRLFNSEVLVQTTPKKYNVFRIKILNWVGNVASNSEVALVFGVVNCFKVW